ncbi:MFS-type transporter SLC18B1 [Halotydeus destructor]|nr:MFS-type transporter SLC18B1 [Halotydeus destructor]
MSQGTQQIFKLLFICMIEIAVFLPLSVMDPMFPVEATSKGLSITTSGLIFSVYPFFSMMTFPVAGYLIPKFGVKYLLMSALCLIGVTQISFGALDFIDDPTIFTYSCFLVRALTSIGAAMCSTCVTFQIFQLFADNLNSAFAFQETFVGLSRALGPQVAAICSSLGGYQLAFYVSGSVPLLILLFVYFQDMKHDHSKNSDNMKPDYRKLLNFQILPITVALITIGVSFGGFTGPTLEPHLRDLSLSDKTVSWIFSGYTISYTISSLIVGKFADHVHETKKLMVAGSILSAFCYLCLGPSPFTLITNSLESNLASMLALGASVGMTAVPSFGVLLKCLRRMGFEDDEATLGLVSSYWLTVCTIGEFLGSSIGGYLVDTVGFVSSTQVVATLNLSCSVLFILQLLTSRGHLEYMPIQNEDV